MEMKPTDLQLNKCNYETALHILEVAKNLHFFASELLNRADKHDESKLEEPEASAFAFHHEKLHNLTYGSKEYLENKKELEGALAHHYANNRHHVPHFKNGVADMNLVDLVEMFCDWKASSRRHKDGNIRKSIEINGKDFNMGDTLISIFENTADLFDE